MTARLIHGAFEQAVRQELEVEREYCAFSRTVRLKGKKETMAFTYKDMYALSPLNNALPIEFMITVKAQRITKPFFRWLSLICLRRTRRWS